VTHSGRPGATGGLEVGEGGCGLGCGGLGGGGLGTDGEETRAGGGEEATRGGGKGGALMDAHSLRARHRAAAAAPLPGAASVRQKEVKLAHCPMFIWTHPCAKDTAGMQGKATLVSWAAPRQAV
jgi:hypothetical protein